MKTKLGSAIVFLAVAGVGIIAANRLMPEPVQFKPIGRDAFLGTLSWLFVVALFIERAVEVIVSVLRDAQATALGHTIETTRQMVGEVQRLKPGEAASFVALHTAQSNLLDYRTATKELALCVSFALGLFVSLAGVRAFAAITVPPSGNANWLFATADMVVTGAVLAGGTDAIHQIANVFSNFMEKAAAKAKGN